MSNYPVNAYDDGDGISRRSSCSFQSSWMSHWTQTGSKQGSLINPHSSAFFSGPSFAGSKQKHVLSSMSSDTAKFKSGKGKEPEAQAVGLIAEKSDYESFRSFSLSKEKRNTLTAQMGLSCGNAATTVSARRSSLARQGDLQPSFGYFSAAHLSLEKKGSAVSKSSEEDYPSKAVVFEGHFSNDNFKSLDHRNSKYETILVHEKKGHQSTCALRRNDWEIMQQDLCPSDRLRPLLFRSQDQFQKMQKDSNLGLFTSQSCAPGSYHGCRPLDVGNVETMRICTTVDSVENSHGGPPMFSQTTHHFLFTKQTGGNLSKRQQIFQEAKESTQRKEGVRIQPLWSSTDDSEEKDDHGDNRTFKVDTRSKVSAETNIMNMGASGNKNVISGMASSQLNKENSRDQSVLMTCADLVRDKIWVKSPITETPNINKELSGLPHEPSSMDGIEPSTSRTQSLDAEHLFVGSEQSSKSKSNRAEDLSPLPEPSSRWVKRLKPSSSDSLGLGTKSSEMGESSSHDKKMNSSNEIIKPIQTSSGPKEVIGSNQNVESSSLIRKSQNMMLRCSSWIRRWCQNPSAAVKPQGNSPAAVICKPDNSNLAFDELVKRQFPSIAAVALMGKSMKGLRPFEFTRRGPLIVWNTKEC